MHNLPTIRDTDIVPESYQMRLMAWRDEFTRGYFEIGDIANEIIMINIQKGMKVEHAMIFAAVGRFCGKSGRTVRDYAEVAAFFPEDMRKNYDMLPFSHFRFAKSCGKDWEKVLDYSMEHPDASEEKLAFTFICGNGVSAEVGVSASPSVSAQPSVSASPSVSAEVGVSAGLGRIYALANLISTVEGMLSWEMQKETKQKLIMALEGLKDVLMELSDKEQVLKYEYNPQYNRT